MTDVVPSGANLTKPQLESWLRGDDLPTDADTSESDYELALKILGSETLDKALEPDDNRPTATLIGKTFTILSCDWRRSTKKEDGEGRYAFLWCVDDDGVKFFTTCGATQVVLLLARLIRDDMLPVKVVMKETKTNTGNTMRSLDIVPEPF